MSDEPVGGRDYPRNQEEFRRFFSTERACLLFLAHLRWRDGFECPSCSHDRYWLRSDGRFLCCGCRRQTSPTAGTVLDKTRLPLSKWLQAIWYVTEETGGVSALSLQRSLGLGSYETAWAMLHKLRRAMEPTSGKLEGTVEVDESFVGGNEPGVRGRLSRTKAKVIIAIERRGQGSGRVRLRQIDDFRAETLCGFVEEVVEDGATVITDGLAAYRSLPKRGYDHIAHNIKGAKHPDGTKIQAHELMPAVHRASALMKRWILGTHQGAVSKELLDYYLAEFAFRYNRRYSRHRGLLFYRLAEQAMQTEPKPYVELLTPPASKRRKRKVKAARKKRAAGAVGKPVNVPRLQPRRPGGKITKLTDSATAKRRFAVKGRRGL